MINIKVLASSSKGNCYMIDDSKTKILIEAGIPIKKIKEGLKFKLYEIEACLITHCHGDHSKAVEDIMDVGIDCYMAKETAEALDMERYELNIFPDLLDDINIGSWRVKWFDVHHDVPTVGFLLKSYKTKEKLLYLTDTYYTNYVFPGLNYILVECNHSYKILDQNVAAGRLHPAQKKRLIQSHMALENVKDMLKANDLSKVKEIYLIHLSDGNSSAKEFKREIQEISGKPTYIAGE